MKSQWRRVGTRSNGLARFMVALVLFLTLGILLGAYAERPTRQGWLKSDAVVSPAPNPATIALGTSDTVTWSITNLDELFSFEYRISFDPTVVQVIDADPLEAGTQVTPGDVPSSANWQVPINQVDNVNGEIWFVASLHHDHVLHSGGGSLMHVEFLVIDTGSSPLNFESLDVSDKPGTSYVTVGVNGVINALPGDVTPSATPTEAPTPTATPTVDPSMLPQLYVSPDTQQVTLGMTTTVDIRIDNATDLYGVEFQLAYDPTIVEVIDANPDPLALGVQIITGTFPVPDYTAVNQVYTDTAIIHYATTQVLPRPPASGGGLAASVVVRGIATGVSPMQFITATLSNSDGGDLAVVLTDGEVAVIDEGLIIGQVGFDGRGVPPNLQYACPVSVTLTAPGGDVPLYTFATATDVRGVFTTTTVVTGTYDVRVRDLHSLWNVYRNLQVDSTGASADFGTLVDGDANLSGVIEILDYTYLANAYGNALGDPDWDPRVDYNNSLAIDLLDYTLLAETYGRSGEVDVTP